MLSPYFYPHQGGVEKHVFNLSQQLIHKGYKITVLTTLHDSKLPRVSEIEEIKIFRFKPNKIYIVGMAITMFKFFKYIKLVYKSNIVHIHDYQLFIWFILIRLLFPFKKIYITFHGWEGECPPNTLIKFFRKISEILTRGNICIGEFIKKWYKTNADIVSYGAAENIKCKNILPKIDILVISRISNDIPILQYLDSFNILNNKLLNTIKIVFIGSGELENEVLSFAGDHNIDISLKGFVDNPSEYICSSSIIITNGYLAILESVLQKKPIFVISQNELEFDRLSQFPFSNNFMSISKNSIDLANNLYSYIKKSNNFKFTFTTVIEWAQNQTWERLANQYIELWNK